jgi:hypothetical protein
VPAACHRGSPVWGGGLWLTPEWVVAPSRTELEGTCEWTHGDMHVGKIAVTVQQYLNPMRLCWCTLLHCTLCIPVNLPLWQDRYIWKCLVIPYVMWHIL